MLRHKSDRATLFVSLVLFPLLPCLVIAKPAFLAISIPFLAYSSYLSGVLSHYHVHSPVFARRGWNAFYSLWLSAFYGFPIQAWVPTHNQNHHKYVNGPGDATRSVRPDSALTALLYPLRSSAAQLPLLKAHVKDMRRRNRSMWWHWNAQIAAVVALQLLFGVGAVTVHGWSNGLLIYTAVGLCPALFAPWAMMLTNYIQHVDCDPLSKESHSRDFVGKVQNMLVFNAGYHTVHHEHPQAHWSSYAKLHAERAAALPPQLQEQSLFGFLWKRYFLPGTAKMTDLLRRPRSEELSRET